MTAKNEITWRHSDSRPEVTMSLALSATQYQTMPDGAPFTTEGRVRLLRSLGLAAVTAIETAKTGGGGLTDPGLLIGRPLRAIQFPSPCHARMARILAVCFALFADPGRRPVYSARTHDGDPADLEPQASRMIGSTDAGAPLLMDALLVVASEWSARVAYAAQAAAIVVDAKLAAGTRSARMIASLAAAVKVATRHNEAETAAKSWLSYRLEEKEILDAALAAAIQVAEEQDRSLPDPFADAAGARTARFAGGDNRLGLAASR